MSVWKKYPFKGANAVLFDLGTQSDANRQRLRATSDLDLVRQRLGVRISRYDLRNFPALPSSMKPKANRLSQKWQDEARSTSGLSDEALSDAASSFLILYDIMQKENAVAMAIDCQPMPGISLPFPCLAMFELCRNGIITACEADINAMLSMMLLTHLAGRPSFMGNIFTEGSDAIAIDHCVTPVGMLDDLAEYELTDRHGDSTCATAAVDLPRTGPATVARISADLQCIHCAVGQLADSHHHGNCRNTVIVRLPDQQAFTEEMLGRHYSVVCADIGDELAAWARESKIALVQNSQ